MFGRAAIACATILGATHVATAAPAIFVNQIAHDARGPKIAVIQADAPLPATATASLIDATSVVRAQSPLGPAQSIDEWVPGKSFYRADFSAFQKAGT